MSIEKNGNRQPLREAGFYQHKETGKIVKLDYDPAIGTAKIDAFVQAGFVRIENLPQETSEVKYQQTKVVSEDKASAEEEERKTVTNQKEVTKTETKNNKK